MRCALPMSSNAESPRSSSRRESDKARRSSSSSAATRKPCDERILRWIDSHRRSRIRALSAQREPPKPKTGDSELPNEQIAHIIANAGLCVEPILAPEYAGFGADIVRLVFSGNLSGLRDAVASLRSQSSSLAYLFGPGVEKDGNRILTCAVFSGHVTILRYLIRTIQGLRKRRGEVTHSQTLSWLNACNATQRSALHFAAEMSNESKSAVATGLLVGAGAHVDARDAFGNTPLMLATRANRMATVKVLAGQGSASLMLVSKSGLTASDMAYEAGNKRIYRLLLSYAGDDASKLTHKRGYGCAIGSSVPQNGPINADISTGAHSHSGRSLVDQITAIRRGKENRHNSGRHKHSGATVESMSDSDTVHYASPQSGPAVMGIAQGLDRLQSSSSSEGVSTTSRDCGPGSYDWQCHSYRGLDALIADHDAISMDESDGQASRTRGTRRKHGPALFNEEKQQKQTSPVQLITSHMETRADEKSRPVQTMQDLDNDTMNPLLSPQSSRTSPLQSVAKASAWLHTHWDAESGTPVRILAARELKLCHKGIKSFPGVVCEAMTRLRELILDSNQLTQFPDAIGRLLELQTFSFKRNQIQTLPESLSLLTKLTHIDASHNRIRSIPITMCRMKSLVTLRLYNNQVATLPESISALVSLETLDLNFNRLESIPLQLGSLPKLRSLDVAHNRLCTLPRELGSAPSLAALATAGNLWRGRLARLTHESFTMTTRAPGQAVLRYLRDKIQDPQHHARLRRSTDMRDGQAQFELANLFFSGDDMERNHVKAFQLYLAAARAGHIGAQRCVSQCYFNGHGVERDTRKAFVWFKSSLTGSGSERSGSERQTSPAFAYPQTHAESSPVSAESSPRSAGYRSPSHPTSPPSATSSTQSERKHVAKMPMSSRNLFRFASRQRLFSRPHGSAMPTPSVPRGSRTRPHVGPRGVTRGTTSLDISAGEVKQQSMGASTAPTGGDTCTYCGNNTELWLCSGCQSVWYCGQKCQNLDWKRHATFCVSTQRLKHRILRYGAKSAPSSPRELSHASQGSESISRSGTSTGSLGHTVGPPSGRGGRIRLARRRGIGRSRGPQQQIHQV